MRLPWPVLAALFAAAIILPADALRVLPDASAGAGAGAQ
jgi:hypothetical protein